MTQTFRILLSSAFLTFCVSTAVCAADPAVPVRLDGRDSARLVFDFPKLVPYEVVRNADTVELTFDTALNFLEPAQLPAGMTRFVVSRPDAETVKVVIGLKHGAVLNHARDKRKIVFTAAEPKAPASTPTPPMPMVAAPVPAVAKEAPAPGSVPASEMRAPETPAPETVVTMSTAAPTRIAVFRRAGFLWLIDDGQSGSAFPPEVDGPQAGFMGKAKPFRFKEGSGWRYIMPPGVSVSVRKKGLLWQVALSSDPGTRTPPSFISVHVDQGGGMPKLKTKLSGAGPVLTFEDPSAGDTLYVVPVSEPNARVEQARYFPEAEVLSADMGFVVRPLRDGVTVSRLDDYAFVTAPAGIKTSTSSVASLAAAGPEEAEEEGGAPPLFNFPAWRMGGIENLHIAERELISRIAEASSSDDKAAMMMALARLYFANNFGHEALGALRMLETQNPDMGGTPDFLALRGAANAMAGHYEEALQNLSDPSIQQNPEVALWIGYAAAATEQWRKADEAFPRTNRLLRRYPDNIAFPFTIYMAESALRLGRVETATGLLDSLGAQAESMSDTWKAAAGYLRGEAYRQKGDLAGAIREWTPVAEGRDRLYHSKASLSLTNVLLQEGTITLKEAVERVDSLRFAWRGDGLEVQILKTLGSLKIRDGQYLSGLGDLKQAAAMARRLGEDPEPIFEMMRKAFTDIYAAETSNIQPLEAISIYQEFADIMPPGPESAAASRRFAGYLVRMDLLDRAAKVLQAFISMTTSQADAASAGAELAAIHLLDDHPAEALKALDTTAHDTLSTADKEARMLLRARAQSRLNQSDDAIRTLSSIDTPDARRLRVDVLWSARRWAEAAQAIAALLPATPPAKLDDATAQLVINMAVASKLAGNTAGTELIKARYAASVVGTPVESAFGVVTREGGVSTLSDRGALLKMAGEVDMFKGFLDSYKAADAPVKKTPVKKN